MTRIVVVSDDPAYAARIRAVASDLEAKVVSIGTDTNLGDLSAEAIMAHRTDVVLLGPGLSDEARSQLSFQLDANHPGTLIVWAVEDRPEVWRLAMQAGARDLIPPTESVETTFERLQRAIEINQRRHSRVVGPAVADESVARGRILTIVSPKGGSGKTMLATNLATGLQLRSDQSVVLVDLDLQFGDVASGLGLRAEYSVVDVINSTDDATAMKAFLTPHPSGLFVLPAPTNPVEAEEVAPDQLTKLLDLLAREFDFVVVDTGAGIDEPTLVAIEQATDVIFITTIDVAAIQALRKAVVVLDRLGLDEHQRWFVLNRASSRTGLSKSEIEEVTGLAIDAEIPSNRDISKSMNEGSPLMLAQGRSRLTKSFIAATELFTSESPKRGARRAK